MTWLLQFFTWWSGQTLGTRFHTWRKGERVGEDEQGNVYYRTEGGAIDPVLGFERRWVIYNGESEASKVPPGWYGWLHHMTDVSPANEAYKPHEWELPHVPNMTGTPAAYRPQGSAMASGVRPAATGDYQAWSPGS
jgi:NADH:ubiquinone oxidoreductase subunit